MARLLSSTCRYIYIICNIIIHNIYIIMTYNILVVYACFYWRVGGGELVGARRP